ncbi:MAG: TnsD family Tn7-like transposition protein [Marinomonas foliarum]
MSLPMPYQQELVYSVIARYGMYRAFLSPKQLLDDVYRDRKVIASIDLPNHIGTISSHYSRTGRCSTSDLLYQHTLLPLFSPFVQEETKNKAIELMSRGGKSGAHLMLGVNASTVRSDSFFRYCPQCAQEAIQTNKELFWRREWFLPGLSICSRHGPLKKLEVSSRNQRHAFLPASLLISNDLVYQYAQLKSPYFAMQQRLLDKAVSLLDLPNQVSPTFHQWTMFYKKIATDVGCRKGKFVAHDLILEHMNANFSKAAMAELGMLDGMEKETGWLRGLFRKHRKSFSYLQHLVVWEAFVPHLSVEQIFNLVESYPKVADEIKNEAVAAIDAPANTGVAEKQNKWKALVQKVGVKEARDNGGGAIYAWLYRNDKRWLMELNRQYKCSDKNSGHIRVDWKARDMQFVRQLFSMLYAAEKLPPGRCMSANWFVEKLGSASMIYKKRNFLPLTWKFLERYSESVTEFQLRRAALYCLQCDLSGNDVRAWELLKGAGLSEQRMTIQTREVLGGMGYL